MPETIPCSDRNFIVASIRKWMAGERLDESERAIIDAALIVNAADHFLLCNEQVAA